MSVLKRAAAQLPQRWQQELKRRHFRRQILRGTFRSDEPEWDAAARWLRPGDWAIDVGANVGHYTCRFSRLVGPQGRVIAFEPVPATFELLAANAALCPDANVTLLNLAASEATQVLGIEVPEFEVGLKNYYGAALCTSGAGLPVMTCAIDALMLPGPVRLLKIDAEGHDAVVLRGARGLLARDQPVVVIESVAPEVAETLAALGYVRVDLQGSPNAAFEHSSS